MPEITVMAAGMSAEQIAWELQSAASECGAGLEIHPNERLRGISLPEIMESANVIATIAGGTAGAKILYNVLRLFMERSKSNEIHIESGGTKVTLKGHSPEQEERLLRDVLEASKPKSDGGRKKK